MHRLCTTLKVRGDEKSGVPNANGSRDAASQPPKQQELSVPERARASLHARDGEAVAKPLELSGVVDRIGGGDAFAGGLLFGLMRGWTESDALDFALHTSAAKHGQVGDASHASEAQIRALMGAGGKDVRR
jgi:hypothetical protein